MSSSGSTSVPSAPDRTTQRTTPNSQFKLNTRGWYQDSFDKMEESLDRGLAHSQQPQTSTSCSGHPLVFVRTTGVEVKPHKVKLHGRSGRARKSLMLDLKNLPVQTNDERGWTRIKVDPYLRFKPLRDKREYYLVDGIHKLSSEIAQSLESAQDGPTLSEYDVGGPVLVAMQLEKSGIGSHAVTTATVLSIFLIDDPSWTASDTSAGEI